MSHHTDLKQRLENIDALPAMPAIARKMLTLDLETETGEAQLLKLIAQDPQISAKVIGLSNASLFGAPGMISSVSDAAMRLGLTQVKSVAIGMATIAAFAKHAEGKFKVSDLWGHSITVAAVMRAIARRMPASIRPAEDEIFLAGLLHDIGYNVIQYIDTPLSDALYERLRTDHDTPLADLEYDLLGTNHGDIGAHLGAHWGLPPQIIEVIRHHHAPDKQDESDRQPLGMLVHVAEKILPDPFIPEHATTLAEAADWEKLGIDAAKAENLLSEIQTIIEQAEKLACAA